MKFVVKPLSSFQDSKDSREINIIRGIREIRGKKQAFITPIPIHHNTFVIFEKFVVKPLSSFQDSKDSREINIIRVIREIRGKKPSPNHENSSSRNRLRRPKHGHAPCPT